MAFNIGDASATSFAELLSGPLIDIYVGEERRHWSLHRNLLCHHSPYFQAEFGNSDIKKSGAKAGKLELVEHDPGAFELLVKWLYQGRIEDVSDMPVDKKWDYADRCQKLYMLCEKIELRELKNSAIDQFRKGCNEAGLVPGAEEIKPVYDRTPASSPFRKLVSKIAARQIMDPHSHHSADTYRICFSNPDFAIDVVNAIREGTGGKLLTDPTEGDSSKYHEADTSQLPNGNSETNGGGDEDGDVSVNGEQRSPELQPADTPTPAPLPNGKIKKK